MEKAKRAVSQDNDLCGQSCSSLFYGNSLPAQAAPRAQETGERVVIVIDPDTAVITRERWKALHRRKK